MRRLPLLLAWLALSPGVALAQSFAEPQEEPQGEPLARQDATVTVLPDGSRLITLSDGTHVTISAPSGSPSIRIETRRFSRTLSGNAASGGTFDWTPSLGPLIELQNRLKGQLDELSTPADSRPKPEGPRVRIHLTTDTQGILLERIRGDETVYGNDDPSTDDAESTLTERPVCSPPCDRDVPQNGRYRIAGDGIQASSEFMLPAGKQALDLWVWTAPSGRMNTIGLWAGLGLGFGLPLGILGGLLAAQSPASSSGGSGPQGSSSVLPQQIAGVALISLAAVGILGPVVYWLATPSSTSVKTSDGVVLAAEPLPGRFRF
ncbi:MAG: hypothetical protein ACYCWW_19050 [Deltaproteobacteria bacterium]